MFKIRKKENLYLLCTFLLLVFSCKKGSFAEYPKWILGEWVAIDREHETYPIGLHFFLMDSCEIRPGYIDRLDREDFLSPVIYIGHTSSYQLTQDTLLLFDLKEKNWKKLKIKFQSKDTLIVYFNNSIKYARACIQDDEEYLFDQVVLNYSSAMMDKTISINKFGNLFYNGDFTNLYEGLYTSSDGKKSFKQIEHLSKMANLKNNFIDALPKRLSDTKNTTGRTMTFIKNNKMVTIDIPYNEYGDPSTYYSNELFLVYKQLLYLEQQMQIQPFDVIEYPNKIEYLSFPSISFKNENNQKLDLVYSEIFYLWTQFLYAKKVDTEIDFFPIYIVDNSIQSDGRYYRYQTDKGETVTLDLGFNFIEENELGDKFQARRKFIPK